MTSVTSLDQSPQTEPAAASRLSILRNLKAFGILAALPLAAMTYLGAELVSVTSPHPSPRRSVVVGSGTIIPPQELRRSLGRSSSPAAVAPLQLRRIEDTSSPAGGMPALRRDDPVGAYVSELRALPTSIEYTVAPGDTLLGILDKLKIDDTDARSVVSALKSAKLDDDVRIKPKQQMTVQIGGTARKNEARPLLSFTIRLDPARRAEITRDISGAYRAAISHENLLPRTYLARGVIDSSLAGAAGDQGVSDSVVAKFANIYAYDIDFQRDIHPGDAFEIYYTEYSNEAGDIASGRGEILYTRLTFGGKVKTYYRYTSLDGSSTDYYDANGKSYRTFLMRTPVDGARISSRFGMRTHPILGYTKLHKGVDFAAPTGTRVYASGAGVVEKASRFGTYGNYVRIRHASGYETAYAHLSRFGRGVTAGARVAQGQLIGYVGTTGRSTGAHLHYEVLKANHQINPMSVRVPTGIKLAGAELERFKSSVDQISAAIKANPANQMAAAGESSAGNARTR